MPTALPPAAPSPAVPSNPTIDPLAALLVGAMGKTRGHALPLIATAFDVTLESGLAVVETRRTFRNDEATSIEVTITFPLPVHATLYALEARLEGRVLTARAQRRKQARLAYEDALERGKAAILHEEVLRGVHMLSVGQIAPGATIEVVTRWAATLAFVQSRTRAEGQLRIPLTVGDIYGHSDLPESDELTYGAPVAQAELVVRCRAGTVSLAGGTLHEGHASVPTNQPIDLLVVQETSQALRGRAADGRDVVLTVHRPDRAGRALDACVLVDRSGSMDSPCSAREPGLTKHRAVTNGLRAMAERLGRSDAIELWQFNTLISQVGRLNEGRAETGRGLMSLVETLAPPEGGTEIGNALDRAIAESQSRDLLLVTDGKSHALDVQRLAQAGRRIAVVLVGEDSLEANVGYLASLTGGDIFVAQDGDLSDILVTALESLRTPSTPARKIEGTLDRLEIMRGGAELNVEWIAATDDALDPILSRAVAALAASVALPALDEAAAAELAEREGLVSHLTSLVLVDEAGAVQETVPAMRKIPLPTPATFVAAGYGSAPRAAAMAERQRYEAMASMPAPSPQSARPDSAPRVGSARPGAPGAPMAPSPLRRGPSFPNAAGLLKRFLPDRDGDRSLAELVRLGAGIDWDIDPGKLQAGDLSSLDRETKKAIRRAATLPEVRALAKKIGIQPVHLIVGLLARAAAARSRTAQRLARALLGSAPEAALSDLARRIGLA